MWYFVQAEHTGTVWIRQLEKDIAEVKRIPKKNQNQDFATFLSLKKTGLNQFTDMVLEFQLRIKYNYKISGGMFDFKYWP